MIPRPPSPSNLIGDNWPDIDEVALVGLGAAIATATVAAQAAEAKIYQDANTYHSLLPEGFEAQVNAAYRVGGMASMLSGWLAKGAAETDATATSVTSTKVFITTSVLAAEALIAAKKAEIAALVPVASLAPAAGQRIQLLQAEIRQTIESAKKDVEALYNDIYTPSIPISPGLNPLTYTGGAIPAAPMSGGAGSGPGNGDGSVISVDNKLPGSSNGQGIATVRPSDPKLGGQKTATPNGSAPSANTSDSGLHGQGVTTKAPTEGAAASGHQTTAVPGQSPTGSSVAGSAASPPAPTSTSGPASGLGGVGNALPKAPSVSAPSAPSLSSSSVLPSASSAPTSLTSGGMSGGGQGFAAPGGGGPGGGAAAPSAPSAPGAPAASAAPQPLLSGAARSLASGAPLASSASAAAFKPPVESTMASSPVQSAQSAPSPGSSVSAAQAAAPPASGAAAGPVGGAGVPAAAAAAAAAAAPLAAPPAAGVPSPQAAVAVASGVAGTVAPSGGSVGTPIAPPNVINTFGGHNVGAKLARMGSRTVGGGLSATPEFTAATALTGALNDPSFGVISEWACAVFQHPGEKPRFVIASREGLSWIPAGLFMPDGVIIAHLDDSIDWAVRKRWRGLRPPARVLSNYARILGEEPRIVVARNYLGLDGLFSARTVVVADDKTVINPNPLRNPGGRHRLEMASPEGWWPQVQSVQETEIAERVRGVASWVADTHDQAFGADPLRAAAVEQIGRSGGDHLWHEVEQRMHYVRSEIMTAPVDAPEPLPDGWNDGLVAAEQMLRGWEAMWLGQRPASRETLADMTYAAVAATM